VWWKSPGKNFTAPMVQLPRTRKESSLLRWSCGGRALPGSISISTVTVLRERSEESFFIRTPSATSNQRPSLARTVRERTAERIFAFTSAGGSETVAAVRFSHENIRIRAGQTVEWDNQAPIFPHTITFGQEPANLQNPSPDVTVDPDGARHAIIASTADSTHSGFIIAAPQERRGLPQAPLGVTRFRVTFPNPGIFPYICALHDEMGMVGQVTVTP